MLRRWRIDRALHGRLGARPAWCAASLFGLVALSISGFVWRGQHEAMSAMQSAHERLGGAPAVLALPSPAGTAPRDFTDTLQRRPTASELAQHVARAAAEAGAQVTAMQFGAAASHEPSMSRLDISLELRGPYPAVKRVLKELQDRHAGLTLKTLRLRAGPTPAEMQAHLALSLWSLREATP